MRRFRLFFRQHHVVLLFLFVIVLTFLYSTLSILRHVHFQSGGFDLGLFDQAVWRYAHFFPPYNTVKERIILGDHLNLTLPLFGFLFSVWDDVRILLIFQAFAVSISSIPVFLIAKKRLGFLIPSFAVTFLYSLFYGIQFGVFFDFHPILIGTALLPFLALALEYKNWRWFWVLFFFSILTQENMGIAIAGIGFLYIFRKGYTKISCIMVGAGIGSSLFLAKASSFFSPVGYQYWPEIPRDIPTIVTRLFDSEEKRMVWLYSYSWFSFLPLFSPGSVLAVLLDLSQYFVTGPEFSRMWSPYMHHRAILSVFLTLGLLDVLSFLRSRRVRIGFLSMILVVVALFCQYHFHFALNKLTKSDYWKKESWMDDNTKLITMVPADARVGAQQNFIPHLSHREEIYLAWPRMHDIESEPCGQKSCWWIDVNDRADYLVVDTRPDQWLTQMLESNEHWQEALANMEKNGTITLEKRVGNAKMFKIN